MTIDNIISEILKLSHKERLDVMQRIVDLLAKLNDKSVLHISGN